MIGASFAENFYGLKRRRRPLFEIERARAAVGGLLQEEKLRDREKWRSLVFLVRQPSEWLLIHTELTINSKVGLPYLRAKAADYFEALGGGIDHDIIDENASYRQTRLLSEEVRPRQLAWRTPH